MRAAKIKGLAELIDLRKTWAAQNQKVVWTNGCFDLLHVGHLRNLRDAKALGDILVVGVNSDSSVREIKGPSRPVVCESERAELVAALEPVDYVCIFDEPTPREVLSQLRPDIHCKGADYADGADRPIPERATVLGYGGEIRFLPFHPGRSTSALIARIRDAGSGS